MDLKEELGNFLDQLKQLKGVESVVLAQRDGNLIEYAGIWPSKDDISNMSSAASTIYNLGIQMSSQVLKYILIDGKKSKVVIAPLSSPLHPSLKEQGIFDDSYEFFITMIAQPQINLGGLFLQSNDWLKKIKTTIFTSGTFKTALINEFNINEHQASSSLDLSEPVSLELEKILKNLSRAVPELYFAYIVFDGVIISRLITKSTNLRSINLDNTAKMSYSLFQIANRCVWLLKKMKADTILLDYESSFQFIYGLEKAIFSVEIGKMRQKLGLIRLIIPQFLQRINKLIQDASGKHISLDNTMNKTKKKRKRGKTTELLPPTKLALFFKLLNEEKYEEAAELVNSYDTNDYVIENDSLVHWTRVFSIRAGIRPWEASFKEKDLMTFKFEKFTKEEFLNKADSEDIESLYYGNKKFLKKDLNLIFNFVEAPAIWLPMKFAPLVIQNNEVSVYLAPGPAKF